MKRVSLKIKILLSVLLTCTLIVLAISFINLVQFRDSEKARILEEFSNFEAGTQKTIREAVWLYDWDMVNTILESQTSQVISFVKICDNKVSKCLQRGTRDIVPFLDFQTPLLYTQGASGKQIEIGSIYLQSHYEEFPRQLFKNLPRLLLANMLIVFSIALILLYLFHKQVVFRLLALEQYTRKIDMQRIDSLDLPAFDSKSKYLDEIDGLADAVCSLVEKTKNELDRRKTLEQQLIQAQKMEAIGTLAGGIAHDFNNILGAIIGYAELAAEDSPAGSMAKNDLEQVLKASHRAKDLVKQILAFSRHGDAQRIPIQPDVSIKEAIKMLRSSLPTTIDIKQDIEPDAGPILADPTQLHQILVNLCTNAFHAMESTGGTLSVTLKRKTISQADIPGTEPNVQPGDFVLLSIADTGVGIAPEIMERMFDPYFTTKEVGKGTGMGLAIIHGIVKSYNGFITCESWLNKGSVFQVFLPVMAEENRPETENIELIKLGNEHILYVDDEEILAEMGTIMFERLGYQVTMRTNSSEALKTFQDQPEAFDLVVTDQTMPGITGIDLARRMLQIRPELQIILCTGFSSLISEEKVKSYGIKGFALKPLAKKDIALLIRKILDGEK
jgi:signal transduction histidine kinase/CheY-like chemotaxis protein